MWSLHENTSPTNLNFFFNYNNIVATRDFHPVMLEDRWFPRQRTRVQVLPLHQQPGGKSQTCYTIVNKAQVIVLMLSNGQSEHLPGFIHSCQNVKSLCALLCFIIVYI